MDQGAAREPHRRRGGQPPRRAARCARQAFVYRRYLDFNVIGALRSLHEQIRQEAVKRATMRPEKADDIKLGRGGIREIEFSAQVFQLIRGGQDAGFRVRPTLEVLTHAVAVGLMPSAIASQLGEAYRFFRRVEHRLQYADDAQTHALPVDPDARGTSCRFVGISRLRRVARRDRSSSDARRSAVRTGSSPTRMRRAPMVGRLWVRCRRGSRQWVRQGDCTRGHRRPRCRSRS
ncbi:MAG: hypothetical protein WDN30_06480 [Pararobbsia sp.]